MRGSRAKKIRNSIYGDYSPRLDRHLSLGRKLRQTYQLAKRLYRTDRKKFDEMISRIQRERSVIDPIIPSVRG